ncbi:MAG: HYD1 signature containing ADP-ribosyltransferase family protein [Acidobacteriota bacterium]
MGDLFAAIRGRRQANVDVDGPDVSRSQEIDAQAALGRRESLPEQGFEVGELLPSGRIAGSGPGTAATIRVRHFTSVSGKNAIDKDRVIRASDQDRVFTVRARGKAGAPRDVEAKLGIKRGRGNAFVEFDILVDEIEVVNNPITGAREFVLKGDVSLEGRNPKFFSNR